MMRPARQLCAASIAGVLALACLPAASAAQPIVTLAPSAAIGCMTPPPAERGMPDYDKDLVTRKLGGTVRVELVFESADAAPLVRTLEVPPHLAAADVALEDSVRRFVSKLRVPCLPAGAVPARLTQDYVFTPNDGRKVMAGAPRDERHRDQRRHQACLTHIATPHRMQFPWDALKRDAEGKFLARLHFASPSSPPQVEFVAQPSGANYESIRAEIRQFVQTYRVPCLAEGLASIDMLFDFRIEGSDRVVVNDMSLLKLLRGAASMPLPAYFELDRLGCPFDVRVEYYQPFKASLVQEFGTSDPARRAFLDWLSAVVLRVPADTALRILGESFTVSVPCGKVDL